MLYYATFGAVQEELKEHLRLTGERLQFTEAADALRRKGRILTEKPAQPLRSAMINHDDPETFGRLVDALVFSITSAMTDSERVQEEAMFPSQRDVFIIRHPRYTRPYLHRHDYVEIDCVIDGFCLLHFEDELLRLPKGSLCLIAPYSRHDIEITDESTVYTIMLRRSTFEAAFFSLLSRKDVLSLFFRTILNGSQEPNYLIFQIESSRELRLIVQNAMLECFRTDGCSNSCCISYVNLLLACVLRSSGDAPQFYRYQMSKDFSLILHYIRHHHQTLTLTDLAEQFHYSKPHLCTLIRQNTGLSFTELIRQIRLARAVEYLLHTELPIAEIAEEIGYHSADHFARVFRGEYGCSPREYRRQNARPEERFIPFATK